MEATVSSFTDGSVNRLLLLNNSPQTPPSCFGYPTNRIGYPCLHGIAVICEKHGATNSHRFDDAKYLTVRRNELYDNANFQIPAQADVDIFIAKGNMLVLSGEIINIPKALSPPRGFRVKNSGVRMKVWYERGPAAPKKRIYSCSLCHQEGHVSTTCELRQFFEPTQQ